MNAAAESGFLSITLSREEKCKADIQSLRGQFMQGWEKLNPKALRGHPNTQYQTALRLLDLGCRVIELDILAFPVFPCRQEADFRSDALRSAKSIQGKFDKGMKLLWELDDKKVAFARLHGSTAVGSGLTYEEEDDEGEILLDIQDFFNEADDWCHGLLRSTARLARKREPRIPRRVRLNSQEIFATTSTLAMGVGIQQGMPGGGVSSAGLGMMGGGIQSAGIGTTWAGIPNGGVGQGVTAGGMPSAGVGGGQGVVCPGRALVGLPRAGILKANVGMQSSGTRK